MYLISILLVQVYSIQKKKNIFLDFFELSLAFLLSFKIFLKKKKIKNINLVIWYGPSSFLWLPVFFFKSFIK